MLNKNVYFYETEAFKRQDSSIRAEFLIPRKFDNGYYYANFINIDYSERKSIDEIIEEVKKHYYLMDSSTTHFKEGMRVCSGYEVFSSDYFNYVFYKDSSLLYSLSIYLPLYLDKKISQFRIDSIKKVFEHSYDAKGLFALVRKQRDYIIEQYKFNYLFRISLYKNSELYSVILNSPFYKLRDSLKSVLKK